MLGWTLTYALISLLAAAIGFGGTTGALALAGQILFVVFAGLFVVTALLRHRAGKPLV
ncbi:DUF1328 domain-containing protein [Falsirhodobacter halotolerans]|uniref:DUF1328 domain-containing protein n=1 Tax=Falsirhodobacter halotolerans TaxID=1146892 RepID=UPI001FD218E2|nr:DUF1328 domain-containing protein [Falsirhodobacter halotolerans]MCJ8140740.1 DUF1328 domain-containing protein [Falsirhodobacter halotolerans]